MSVGQSYLSQRDLQNIKMLFEDQFKQIDERFVQIDSRFAQFERKINLKFDQFFRDINEYMDIKLDARFEEFYEKIEEMFDRKFDEKFDKKFDEKFDEKFNENFKKYMMPIAKRLDYHDSRLDFHEEEIVEIRKRIYT